MRRDTDNGDGTGEIVINEDRESQPNMEAAARRASGGSRDGGRERNSGRTNTGEPEHVQG